ncbi:MAG TPA: ribose-5-phosphate isomerase RpiA [Gemmatimonadales bacterium]|nr:ribose-5-phosphate isomerase RpiA [Gemmatimonadales bacterium]
MLRAATQDELKRAAAARAVTLIQSGMVVGLGTGSTVRPLLELLGARLASRELEDVVGVPTSENTASICRALDIPLTTLEQQPHLDLAIDGADEIGPGLDLIKGLGGALLREKLVAVAAKRFVVIADESKRVRRLGTRAPVPVEVVPFGWSTHLDYLRRLGAEPALRRTSDGEPYRTDGGHFIVDCRFVRGIPDPRALARALARRTGVVEDGLFLGMAHLAIIAGTRGVRQLKR